MSERVKRGYFMRYSINHKTKAKANLTREILKIRSAHLSQISPNLPGRIKESTNKIIIVMNKKFPKVDLMGEAISAQRSKKYLILSEKVVGVLSFAHKEKLNIEKVKKRSRLNIVIFQSLIKRILTSFSAFQGALKKSEFQFLIILLAIFLISSTSFATDFTKQASDLVQASHGMRDSQMNEIHQFLENIHNPSPETNPSSPSNEIAEQDSQKDAWGEAPLPEFTTPPAIKSVPDQHEGDTCCRAPNNLELTEIQHSFKESTSQKEGELLIFVSFSLPDQALKNLYEESRRLNARLILRGLHKNSFQETRKKAQDLGIQADIDPTLFEKHVVKVIPTFVLERKDQADKVSGNISAQEALGILQGELE